MPALSQRSLRSLAVLVAAGALAFGCSSSDDDESPPCRDCVYPTTTAPGVPPGGPVGTGLPSAGGTTQTGTGGTNPAPATGGTGATSGSVGGSLGGSLGGTGGNVSSPIPVGGSLGFGGTVSTGGTGAAGGTDPFGSNPFGTGATGGI
jgi:hypothetical protein